jgi:hypothetical protein
MTISLHNRCQEAAHRGDRLHPRRCGSWHSVCIAAPNDGPARLSGRASGRWQRILQQHDAGKNHPERIRGWYNLAGGGAGFLLVEYDDPRELSRFLTPYMDLLSFDVRAIYETKYDEAIRRAQQEYGVGTTSAPTARGT